MLSLQNFLVGTRYIASERRWRVASWAARFFAKYGSALGVFLLVWPLTVQTAIPSGESPIRARLGWDEHFPTLFSIPPGSDITPLALSPDAAWVYIQYQGRRGWIENHLTLTDLPPYPHDLPQPPRLTDHCITLIGDSVAYGDVVYQVPGHGYAVLREAPLSEVMRRYLPLYGLQGLDIRDRSASAAFLSPLGRFPYRDMPAYEATLSDRCRWTVIMPWVNDMSITREDPAAAHIADLSAFIQTLQAVNPYGRILVVGFYHGQRADFVEAFAPGFTPAQVDAFNAALREACPAWQRVTCLDSESLFLPIANAHVVLTGTQEGITAALHEPIPADVLPYFETFWRDYPNVPVVGDGVHLSEVGKVILGEAIIVRLLRLDPTL